MTPLRYLARFNWLAGLFHVEFQMDGSRFIELMSDTRLESFCAEMAFGWIKVRPLELYLDADHFAKQLDDARMYFWYVLEAHRSRAKWLQLGLRVKDLPDPADD